MLIPYLSTATVVGVKLAMQWWEKFPI